MTALETLLKKLEEKANSAQPVAIHAHETGIFTIQENTVVTDKETIKKLIAVIRRFRIPHKQPCECDACESFRDAIRDCEKIVRGE